MDKIAVGTTDVSIPFHLDTAGLTIADMKLGYIRWTEGDGTSFTEVLSVALTELATISTAHTDNFAKYLDTDATGGNQFILRVDFPDDAFTTEQDFVICNVYDDGNNVISQRTFNLRNAEFTINEIEQIRHRLNLDGTQDAPTAGGAAKMAGTDADLTLNSLSIIRTTAGPALLAEAQNAGNGATFRGENSHGIESIGDGIGQHGLVARADSDGDGIFAQGKLTGDGFRAEGGATNGDGIKATGVGTGHGIESEGGALGNGMQLLGGLTSGNGLNIDAQTSGAGMVVLARGSNMNGIQATGIDAGSGIQLNGGATGDGLKAFGGSTSGDGISATGGGTGTGVNITGGVDGTGMTVFSGATSGHGIEIKSTGSGFDGIKITTGTVGNGISTQGSGTGHGIFARSGAGATGDGIRAQSVATDGNGMILIGIGAGDGIVGESGAGATGSGMRMEAKSTNGHGIETIKTGTGIDLKATDHGDGSWETATAGSSIEKYPEGGIFFDPTSGSSGTVLGTDGTSDNPVNVEDDARTLAIALGTNKIFIAGGDYNVAGGSSKELKGFSLLGLDGEASLSIESNTSASFSKITSLDIAVDVNGTTGFPSNGIIEFVDSRFDVNGFKSTSSPLLAKRCKFITSSVGGADEPVTLFDCFTDKSDVLSLDAFQTGAIMDVKRFVGNLKLINETNSQTHNIHMQGGDIEIAASNTNGTVILTGWGTLTDNNGGMTVDVSAFSGISAGNTHSDLKAMSGVAASAAKLEQGAAAIATGAAIAGTLSTTEMTTDLTELTNNHYKGLVVKWTTGALAEQGSEITAYDGATKKLTFIAVTDAPSATDKFVIN